MSSRTFVRVGLVLVIALALTPSSANAKGLVLITHGDKITELGDHPPEAGLPPGVKVGFKSSHFGIFWIDLWTWGGEFCISQDKKYVPIDRAVAAQLLGKPESELNAPFLYRFPLGLLILGGLAVILVGFKIHEGISTSADKKKTAELYQDAMYLKALELASAPAKPNPGTPSEASTNPDGTEEEQGTDNEPSPFQAGVKYLVESGVEPADAERNLKLMFRYPSANSQLT